LKEFTITGVCLDMPKYISRYRIQNVNIYTFYFLHMNEELLNIQQ